MWCAGADRALQPRLPPGSRRQPKQILSKRGLACIGVRNNRERAAAISLLGQGKGHEIEGLLFACPCQIERCTAKRKAQRAVSGFFTPRGLPAFIGGAALISFKH